MTVLSLAPIRGITDRIYRDSFAVHFGGIDYAVAPFVAATKGKNIERKILREFEGSGVIMKTIPQILSNDPEDFVPIANSLFDMGHECVNWNIGCPFPMVVNKGKGAGMLCYPSRIDSFLSEVLSRVKCRISVKLRLGLRDGDDIFHIIPLLNGFNLAEVIIHPRTGAQMYEGSPDFDAFGECASKIKHPVVYNGDIVSLEGYGELSSRFKNIKSWMIGRGALMNPFLPSAIKGTNDFSLPQKTEKLRSFHDDLYSKYGNLMQSHSHLLDRMKSEWTYLAQMFGQPDKVRKRIKKTGSTSNYLRAVSEIFDAGIQL